jgi:hypothetical protein
MLAPLVWICAATRHSRVDPLRARLTRVEGPARARGASRLPGHPERLQYEPELRFLEWGAVDLRAQENAPGSFQRLRPVQELANILQGHRTNYRSEDFTYTLFERCKSAELKLLYCINVLLQ